MIPTKIVFFILWVFMAESAVVGGVEYTTGWAPARLFSDETKCNDIVDRLVEANPDVKHDCRRLDDLPKNIVQPKGPQV